MAPTRRPNDGLLARVNFPLYSVEMLTSRHVLVAGGGGSAKTGVANGFEIYEIFHNGNRFMAEEVIRHETGPSVVMNCAVKGDGRRSFILAGQESHCQLYTVNMKVIDPSSEGQEMPKKTQSKDTADTDIRNRKKTSGVEDVKTPPPVLNGHIDSNGNCKKIKFEIKTNDSTQTDFFERDPLQRVVRVSPTGKFVATGGTDGVVRIWKFPTMIKCKDLKGHTKEIDDLDFSIDSKSLISIAKDGQAIIWDMSGAKNPALLKWAPPDGTKYLFKRCRYGVFEGKTDKSRVFTIVNPLGKTGKQRGFLQNWDPDSASLTKQVPIDESLASLAVRDDGRFVAVGTMLSGSVSIYTAFNLQRVLHIPNAHSMFVTGLEFLPLLNNDGPAISSDSEAAVVSISVDNRICIHSLQLRHSLPFWVAFILIIGVLFLTLMFCSYVGL